MNQSAKQRRQHVDRAQDLSMARQCDLLQIHRSGLYYKPVCESKLNLELMRIIDEKHMLHPWLGFPRRSNQVWAMDITYISINGGFLYLVAVIDLYSRYVVNWSLSNTMTAEWCRSVLEQAIDNIFIERLWRSVKYEEVYIRPADDGLDCYKGLKTYFEYYNHERRHQSLGDEPPALVYQQNFKQAA